MGDNELNLAGQVDTWQNQKIGFVKQNLVSLSVTSQRLKIENLTFYKPQQTEDYPLLGEFNYLVMRLLEAFEKCCVSEDRTVHLSNLALLDQQLPDEFKIASIHQTRVVETEKIPAHTNTIVKFHLGRTHTVTYLNDGGGVRISIQRTDHTWGKKD